MPAKLDLTVWRGNNAPVIWQPVDDQGQPFPLAGSEFVLTVVVKGRGCTTIRKDSAVNTGLQVDTAAGTITWKPTLEESRAIPIGRLSSYELERRIAGDQRTWAIGDITGEGGLGDD